MREVVETWKQADSHQVRIEERSNEQGSEMFSGKMKSENQDLFNIFSAKQKNE